VREVTPKHMSRGQSEASPSADSNPLREAHEKLAEAEGLRRERKFDRAESICTALVRRYPDYFGAQHTLGLTYADKGDYPRAAACLGQAAMLNPRSWMTQTALAGVYLRLDANEMAAHILEIARSLKPKEPSILVTLGEIYSEEREYELAREAYREALQIEPGMEEAAIGLARACTSLGENAEAADSLDGLLKRGVRSLGVLSALISLPVSAIRRDLLSELHRVVRRADEEKADFEVGVAFVRTAALDKARRHAEAWEQAMAANRLVAAGTKKELTENIARREASLKWLRENSIKAKTEDAGDEGKPISLFILGPSRSGKTTMESLVGVLDGVKRGYENPSVENAISRTYQDAGLLTTYTLDYLPPQFFPQVREIYAEEVARRAGSVRVFTNTHPGYMHEVGRLAQTLPNVRFIFVKRKLDDVILRMFMRLYLRGNSYSYDLKAARDYVEWYYQMMDLMAEKLPEIVRVVRYEDMVADPGTALQTAANLCGVPMTHKPIPALGDDRECAAPYRERMAAELSR
jgi:tetratricopeptide (TPR) repeat protein